jgi:hypothetical protein
MEWQASRPDLVLASLMAALPLGITGAGASPLNPVQTIIKPPDALQWKTLPPFPPASVDTCPLTGETTAPGLYYTLVRWHPGYMSAPHFYSTDRYCMVLSGVWWCNSGADFDPAACVPVPAGSYVRRVALTPHYDGVIRSHNEPGSDRDLRYRSRQLHPQRSIEAAVAGSMTARRRRLRRTSSSDRKEAPLSLQEGGAVIAKAQAC